MKLKLLLSLFWISFALIQTCNSLALQDSRALNQQGIQSSYRIGVTACEERIDLLDIFEARILRGLQLPADKNIEFFLSILRTSMPDRANLYEKILASFQKSIQEALQQEEIGPRENIPERDLILKPPKGCHSLVLLTTDFSGALQLRKPLWDALSSTDKAAVFLNWAIAYEAFLNNLEISENSIYVRNLNSLILSNQIAELPFLELTKITKAAGLRSLRKQGVLIDLLREFTLLDDRLIKAFPVVDSEWLYQFAGPEGTTSQSVRLKGDAIRFYPNGVVESLRFKDQLWIQTLGGKVSIVTPDDFSQSPVSSEASPRIHFFPSGRLKRGFTIESTLFKSDTLNLRLAQGRGRWESQNRSLLAFFAGGQIDTITQASGNFLFEKTWQTLSERMSVVLYENQMFKEITTKDTLQIPIQGQETRWKGYLSFKENGQLTCGFIDQNINFLNHENLTQTIHKGEQVCFNTEGLAL
jgi:hypothetical protein